MLEREATESQNVQPSTLYPTPESSEGQTPHQKSAPEAQTTVTPIAPQTTDTPTAPQTTDTSTASQTTDTSTAPQTTEISDKVWRKHVFGGMYDKLDSKDIEEWRYAYKRFKDNFADGIVFTNNFIHPMRGYKTYLRHLHNAVENEGKTREEAIRTYTPQYLSDDERRTYNEEQKKQLTETLIERIKTKSVVKSQNARPSTLFITPESSEAQTPHQIAASEAQPEVTPIAPQTTQNEEKQNEEEQNEEEQNEEEQNEEEQNEDNEEKQNEEEQNEDEQNEEEQNEEEQNEEEQNKAYGWKTILGGIWNKAKTIFVPVNKEKSKHADADAADADAADADADAADADAADADADADDTMPYCWYDVEYWDNYNIKVPQKDISRLGNNYIKAKSDTARAIIIQQLENLLIKHNNHPSDIKTIRTALVNLKKDNPFGKLDQETAFRLDNSLKKSFRLKHYNELKTDDEKKYMDEHRYKRETTAHKAARTLYNKNMNTRFEASKSNTKHIQHNPILSRVIYHRHINDDDDNDDDIYLQNRKKTQQLKQHQRDIRINSNYQPIKKDSTAYTLAERYMTHPYVTIKTEL